MTVVQKDEKKFHNQYFDEVVALAEVRLMQSNGKCRSY